MIVIEILHVLLSNKDIRFRLKEQFQGPSLPPALCNFWVERGGILKSCNRVLKLSQGLGGDA